MAVNLTLNVFILTYENLTFLGRNYVLPAAAWCYILPVLNHAGTACVSGIQQMTGVMSQWLTRVGDCERQQLFREQVYSNSFTFNRWDRLPIWWAIHLLVFECRQSSLFVLSSEELCGDCLRMFAKGWVWWNTLQRHLLCKQQCRPQRVHTLVLSICCLL